MLDSHFSATYGRFMKKDGLQNAPPIIGSLAVNTKQSRSRKIVALASGISYLAALPTPALHFANHSPVKGITTLLAGWWGVITGDIPWFANPVYFLALVLMLLGCYKSSQLLCALALGLGVRSVYVEQWFFNEAGGTPITALGLAFYLWVASFVILLIGSASLQWSGPRWAR